MASMYVEIDLVDVDDDELIEELASRGYTIAESGESSDEALKKIYNLKRLGKPYEQELDAYICNTLGKVI